MPKIKDLNKFLTKTTGLNAAEREAWRNKIAELSAALKVFQSFSYWKHKYYR